MCTHIWGSFVAKLSNITLKHTANENRHHFGDDAANTILHNFYVDDLLKSLENEEQAISLLSRVQSLCAEGGFNLTKVLSSSPLLIESVPQDKRAPSVKSFELGKVLPVERALGVRWCVENDTLGFRILIEDNPLTRRGILSTISSIFDPLGLVAPFLLKGRKILQLITADHYGWDDGMTYEQIAAWRMWRKDLPLLNKINVERCYKPRSFGDAIDISLHHFGDGSINVGYGTAHYIRQVNKDGHIHVSLAMGKSRVTPLKSVTIPRIELTSGNTAVEVGSKVRSALNFDKVSESFWLDSMVALGYIYNERKRFRIFVANRVSKIRALSNKEQWRYIESENNPADLATRGISPTEVDKLHTWFHGPSFLWKPENHWDKKPTFPKFQMMTLR